MAGVLRRTLSVLSSELASSVRRGVGAPSTRAVSLGAFRCFARGADADDGQDGRAKMDEDKMIAEMENEEYTFDTVGCENPTLELMNSCLSNATKEKMYAMHQEDKNTCATYLQNMSPKARFHCFDSHQQVDNLDRTRTHVAMGGCFLPTGFSSAFISPLTSIYLWCSCLQLDFEEISRAI